MYVYIYIYICIGALGVDRHRDAHEVPPVLLLLAGGRGTNIVVLVDVVIFG